VKRRPWLILADVGMPEVDGFEFCRRVRSNALLSHTPLVFVSGSAKYKERHGALQLGADDSFPAVRRKRRRADRVFGFREGGIISATVQDLSGPQAVYAFLDQGQFQVRPR